MEMKEVMALVNAGYTKADIDKMQNQFTLSNQMQTQFTQPNQMQTQFTQANQFTQPNQMQSVDYKTLYETQKKMLEDMQTLNLTGTKGAPIDTPLSVVNDFLGGEK